MDIKRAIKKSGMTMEETAQRMGISRVTLSQNITRNPTLSTMQRIAGVVGCNVSDFFLDEKEDQLSALVECKGVFYKASTVEELEGIVKKIKGE
jgi:transcriptional regulator with XRE-family HTH domain